MTIRVTDPEKMSGPEFEEYCKRQWEKVIKKQQIRERKLFGKCDPGDKDAKTPFKGGYHKGKYHKARK